VFRSTTTLGPLYGQLVRESVLSVKAEQVASFLGRQITPQLAQQIGSQFSTRIEGTCIANLKNPLGLRRFCQAASLVRASVLTNFAVINAVTTIRPCTVRW
jgi:hypothetical protein